MKKIVSLLTVLTIFFGMVNVAAAGTEALSEGVSTGSDAAAVDEDILLLSENAVSYTSAAVKNGEFDIFEMSEGSKLRYDFDVPADGEYCVLLSYSSNDSENLNEKFEYSLKFDDAYPNSEFEKLEMPFFWENYGENRIDAWGNEFAAEQTATKDFIEKYVEDSTGITLEPYTVTLNKGRHSLELSVLSGSFNLKSVRLRTPENPVTYEEYIADFSDVKIYEGEQKNIEAENAAYKSSKSLVPKSDESDPSITPISDEKSVINSIGSGSWSAPGQTIIWKVYVPEDCLYKIGFKYKQDELMNGISYRRMRIDGRIPFKEADRIEFEYDTGWRFKEFSDSKDSEYLLYLTEGYHTISLEVTLGEVSNYYQRLEKQVSLIGNEYLKIAMITGDTPDKNRDYDLFQQVPDLSETLNTIESELSSLATDMKQLNGDRAGSIIATINNMVRIVNLMLKNPYDAHIYLSDYYTNYTSISAWLYDMKSMPLALDKIVLGAPDKEFEGIKASAFEKIGFSVKKFLASFTDVYATNTDDEEDSLTIWVNWGMDQTQVLSNLIQSDFTQKTGIKVNLKIVNATIAKGILSGDPPDIALHLQRTEPVNLAMRDVLYDLSQFDDCEEVLKRFQSTAADPYKYNGGLYALPDTQSFYILYYRKDILEELNIEVPKTWEDFIDATVEIQRKKMNVWMPYTNISAATTVNTGIGGLSLFPTLVLQNGLSLYNNEQTACTLNDRSIADVFEFWSDFYTKYKVPKEASFYNRLRIGTMPMGIETYTLYQTLSDAAPEIDGRWGIAPIPGIENEDGTINNTSSGAGTGASIIKGTGNEEKAWEFIKWWTSADVQFKYSSEIETILGAVSRVATANVEAFKKLSWKSEDLAVLLEQWSKVTEIPEIPGSYYLSRAVDQCFWNIVGGTDSMYDSLFEWSNIVDSEIERKITEYKDFHR